MYESETVDKIISLTNKFSEQQVMLLYNYQAGKALFTFEFDISMDQTDFRGTFNDLALLQVLGINFGPSPPAYSSVQFQEECVQSHTANEKCTFKVYCMFQPIKEFVKSVNSDT